MRQKIQSIINELKSKFYERERIIEACWAALLSKHHLLQLGPPGTAKSQLTTAICGSINGAQYFERLLTRFSPPEELFGPISLKGMENDQYRRIITRKLPEAHIAFVDEIFKGNAAILNSMLTAINERAFDNDVDRIDIPLISVFGASNELPEEEELLALYDRFILRFYVPYIQDGSKWEALVACGLNGGKIKIDTTITLDELYQAQAEVKQVTAADGVIPTMRDIKMSLEQEGLVASDRRWLQTMSVLQAWAWIHDRDEIEVQDLELLCDMLWKDPNERSTLVSKILSVTNPLDLEATRFYDDCLDVFSKFSPELSSAQSMETAQKLKAALEQIDSTLKIADPAKIKRMKEVRGSIAGWYSKVVSSLEL
jgi:MoxR-like ATPase